MGCQEASIQYFYLSRCIIVTRSILSWEADRVLLKSCFNNLTEDKQQQTSCHNLTEEMEQLRTKFKKLAGNLKVVSVTTLHDTWEKEIIILVRLVDRLIWRTPNQTPR